MKFWWILVILALLLLVWGFRESFEPTQSIKSPPYDEAEKERIFNMVRQRSATAPYTFLGYQDLVMARAKSQNPSETDEKKLRVLAGGLLSPAIETFFKDVYKPASTPITAANIDTFMTTRTSDLKDVEKDVLTTYFIGQGGVGSSAYTNLLAEEKLNQNYGYASQNGTGPNAGATGTTGANAGATGTTGANAGATGTTGANAGATGTTGANAGATGTTSGTTSGTASGTTSGTTSGTASGIGGRKQMVFGPTFTGMADGSGVSPADSSKTNQYPELLGGGGSTTSRREAGAGGAGFGFGGLGADFGAGALPSSGGLGADPNSRFFPTSRQPGDMETIPDPYRVSQQFESSSYSFKTEPVPFLTDFSAFYR